MSGDAMTEALPIPKALLQADGDLRELAWWRLQRAQLFMTFDAQQTYVDPIA